MAVLLTKPWTTIDAAALDAVPGQLGVYELADADHRVLFVGRADARSLFGLKGEIARDVRAVPEARAFRYEVTSAYHTRHLELLMAHASGAGLPPVNVARGLPALGRLRPG